MKSYKSEDLQGEKLLKEDERAQEVLAWEEKDMKQ